RSVRRRGARRRSAQPSQPVSGCRPRASTKASAVPKPKPSQNSPLMPENSSRYSGRNSPCVSPQAAIHSASASVVSYSHTSHREPVSSGSNSVPQRPQNSAPRRELGIADIYSSSSVSTSAESTSTNSSGPALSPAAD